MNILFIENSIPPYLGGVQRVSWQLRDYFVKDGHDVFFAFSIEDSDEVDATHKMRYDLKKRVEELYLTFRKFILDNQVDVVINQKIGDKKLLEILYHIRNEEIIKLIGCFHLSPDYLDYKKVTTRVKNGIKKLLFISKYDTYLYAYHTVDIFVLLSESFIDEMCRRCKLPDKNKIRCIPNPLSFVDTIKPEEMVLKEKIVLIVSRLEETQKNIKSALRIWKDALNRGKTEGWQLVLGGYGASEDEILAYADFLHLRNFKYIGKVYNTQELFKSASLFMMTSRYEGFGLTLTEALQNGCVPMAFDNLTALHDILEDGINGLIIPSGEERIYADKLVDLMNNDELRLKMAKQAVKSASKFSIEKVGKKWLDLLREL